MCEVFLWLADIASRGPHEICPLPLLAGQRGRPHLTCEQARLLVSAARLTAGEPGSLLVSPRPLHPLHPQLGKALQCLAPARAQATLSPMARMAEAGGPTNAMPACSGRLDLGRAREDVVWRLAGEQGHGAGSFSEVTYEGRGADCCVA